MSRRRTRNENGIMDNGSPGSQHFENFSMCAGKGESPQLLQGTPASVVKFPGQPVGEFNAIDVRRDAVTSDRVPHLMERPDVDRARTQQPFRKPSFVCLVTVC